MLFKTAIAVAIAVALWSCGTSGRTDVQDQTVRYMDIPGYFQSEIQQLQQVQPTIVKTVKKDTVSESKTIQIDNWQTELSSFTNIDLNKPSYQGYIIKDSADRIITYTFTKPDLDLSKVEIQYNEQQQPTTLRIHRTIKNSLYNTEEVLFYDKNKKYSLEKKQSVRILGDNYYFIEGRFFGGE